ncbi:MAG: outer membrane protein assembly factor BamD [Lentisphaeria bacterium]|nr:outer membrane protein assembly factor BamD [Lentisphaeria bacterium]
MNINSCFSVTGKWIAVLLFCLQGLLFTFPAAGSDQEANEAFLKGRKLEKEGDYQNAASCYKDARILADSPAIKGNSLIAAARNFRRAGLYGEEFDCLERLIRDHLSGIEFSRVVNRLYEIGDLYFQGHRDAPVSWLPFLQKDDRTIEVYEAALKHAPCAERSPESRLRLARLYIDRQNVKKAMHHLTETGKLYPGTQAAHDATLELASILFQLAKNGDGDNAYSRRTLEVLDEFEKKYPDSKEIFWVKKHRQKVLDFVARRLDAIGDYYRSIGRKETAGQYFAEVVKNYSDTDQAAKSERKLADLDKDYKVPENRGKYESYRYPVVRGKDGSSEWMPVKTTPENSDNKWFFPVRDLEKSSLVNAGDLKQKDKENRTEKDKKDQQIK